MKHINFAENNNVVRTESANIFLKEMNRYKQLSQEELCDLIIRAHNGDSKARERAIKCNLRIVWSMAAAYNGMDMFDDILQNANIGLIMAVDTYDVSRETMFSTWAAEQIRKYINIGLTDESRVVRKPKHLQAEPYAAASMDAPIGGDGEDGERTLLDTFASGLTADTFSKVADMRVQIEILMRGLKDVEKAVIVGLFALNGVEETENTLAAKYGLTRERIRQIKWEALEKMATLTKK